MARILIAGGLDEQSASSESQALRELARCLGRQIIEQGHDLLTGAQTELDSTVAKAACETLGDAGDVAHDRVVSYVLKNAEPSHNCGRILRSQLTDWERLERKLRYPEPIYGADVVILLGGWDGTHRAANWARIAKKPILPIAGFGLAAAEVYEDELANFETNLGDLIQRQEFEILNQVFTGGKTDGLAEFAKEVVSLAERAISPTTVFVVMSFQQSIEYEAIYKQFQEVSKAHGFTCFRVDKKPDQKDDSIIKDIKEGIRKAAFVIADVSEPKPNVYYELGFAYGAEKPVIVTAKKDTKREFDIYDTPIIFWSKLDDLEKDLGERVAEVAKRLGR